MIKVKLSEGGYKTVRTKIPDSIIQLAKEFWDPEAKGYKIFSTKRKSLYSELIPVQNKKYVFLKIRNIRKVAGNDTDLNHNIHIWCKDGHMNAFYNDPADDPYSTEIFGLERQDLKELRNLNFESYDDDPNIRINAVLYSKNNINRVYFYLTKDIQDQLLDDAIFFDKTNTSGVKVPRGSA